MSAVSIAFMALIVTTASPAAGADATPFGQTHRRTFSIELHEFTRPHLDVSPDGEQIVFDVLGDVFVVPLAGGKASLLIGGPSWDRSPQWSPDGQQIAFLSDRIGASNIWTYDLRSAALSQVTTYENPRRFGVQGAPAWSRDGQTLFGTFGWRTPQARQVYEYDARSGQALGPVVHNWSGLSTGKPIVMSYMGTPSFTPNGPTAYFDLTHIHRNAVPGRMVSVSTNLAELDRHLGSVREISPDGNVNEFSPRVSRSGQYLAFGRQPAGEPAELIIRNLENGQERSLIELEDVTAFSTGQWEDDAIPAFAFTPDDKFIIISDGGKIVSVRIADGTREEIPITVRLRQDVAEPVRSQSRIDQGPVRSRAIRWPSWVPLQRKWIFSAVGCLWMADRSGMATALTPCGEDIETMPAVSPDGSKVAFVAYEVDKDAIANYGRLKIRDISTGDLIYASPDDGYSVPEWSPDGLRLAVIREHETGDEGTATFGWIDMSNKSFHPVGEASPSDRWDYRGAAAQAIHFSADSDHLIFTQAPAGGGESSLLMWKVGLDAKDPILIAIARSDIRGALVSPDLKRIAALGWDNRVYLGTIPEVSDSPLILSTAGVSLKPLPAVTALYVSWIGGDELSIGSLNNLSVYDVSEGTSLERTSVTLEVPRRGGIAEDSYALTHALAITMNGPNGAGRVIEDATILISNGVITDVGRRDDIALPDETLVVRADGWTVMPGLVESHMHGLLGAGSHRSVWGYPKTPSPDLATSIAYGVTTVWDAWGSYDDAALERTELIDAGRLIGSRWLHAGGGFGGWIDNGDIWSSVGGVRSLVTQAAALGAPCLKHNNWYVRRWTQELAETARRNGLCVIGHGANRPQMLSLLADGIALDHFSLPENSYADIVEFIAQSDLPWTPNAWGAAATGRGPQVTAARSFIDELRTSYPEQWDKLRRYAQAHIDSLDYLPSMPYEATAAFQVAKLAARVAAKGGTIVSSADTAGNYGQIQIHAEMWGFARAGMSNGEALRTATLNGAIKLGLQDQVGSIEVGKLADLVVLEGNPLKNIEASLSIKYTIIGGRIYDAQTVERVSPEALEQRLQGASRAVAPVPLSDRVSPAGLIR